jgi:hypothetical protein
VTATDAPEPVFEHLLTMTDHRGTFEHASLSEPRREGGYCTDDMARVLVVAARQDDSGGAVNGLARIALQFLKDAQSSAGPCRNRMDRNGRWTDEPAAEDAWGRCLWGLGTAAARSDVSLVRRLAVVQFERSARVRSPWPRAMAFATLGAAEVLAAHPGHRAARSLVADYAAGLPAARRDARWPWPEPRLSYANAVLPEAMIAAGVALGDAALRRRGLDLLEWLVGYETGDGHLSPTPAGGRGPGDAKPGFDQQPIEISSIADACARAAGADPSPMWSDGVRSAAAWFEGANDAGEPMWERRTGAGFDGLCADGVNRNQGAESTLAVLSTLQHARRFSVMPQ